MAKKCAPEIKIYTRQLLEKQETAEQIKLITLISGMRVRHCVCVTGFSLLHNVTHVVVQ